MPPHAYTATLPRARRNARATRARARAPLAFAALCALAMLALWALAEHVYAFEIRDTALLRDFTRLNGQHVGVVCKVLLGLLEPLLFTIWGLALMLFAIARSRPRIAVAVVAVMALAPLSAEILKQALAHPHVSIGGTQVGAASWPSGHATAATALALSAVLVTPPRWRRPALLVAIAFVLAVGAALLIREWHLPSDVLGGYLLGSLYVSLALAAVRASERRWPRRAREGDERTRASAG
ncbi:MAG TPA: phosphatase PAP2 family protein [Solirubrobacteraceae bacterium]|jgi:membrane-associated phospholipid phosphatase|nr:phosphatase PAP2 family protein [Solirubrobacteraceae bacterium]